MDNNYTVIVSRLCVNFIGVNTSILKYCWRSEVKCDCLTTVQLSPAVFLLKYFVIFLNKSYQRKTKDLLQILEKSLSKSNMTPNSLKKVLLSVQRFTAMKL